MAIDQKEYYSIDEASKLLEWNRATLYKWTEKLGIQRYKFSLSKKAYIASADVEKLKEIKEKPWLAEQPTPIDGKISEEE